MGANDTTKALDQATIEALKVKHGPLFELTSGTVTVVVRLPLPEEWSRYCATPLDEVSRMDALEVLFRGCVVHPASGELAAAIDGKSGAVALLSLEFLKAVGDWAADVTEASHV